MSNIGLKPFWPRWSALRPMVERMPTVYHGFASVWWTVDRTHLYRKTGTDLPCDPRGVILMEVDTKGFLLAAEFGPEAYGKHGLDALAAAFHGSIIVTGAARTGWPTTCVTWDEVNALIDAQDRRDEE